MRRADLQSILLQVCLSLKALSFESFNAHERFFYELVLCSWLGENVALVFVEIMADSNLANDNDQKFPRPDFKFTEFQLRKFRRAFYLKGKFVDA